MEELEKEAFQMVPSLLPTCGAASQDGDLCQYCSEIDFDDVFRQKLPERPRKICGLSHISTPSNCPLCRFFRACILNNALKKEIPWVKLVLGRTAPVFGTHQATDTPMLRLFRLEGRFYVPGRKPTLDILPAHGTDGVTGRHIRKEVDYEVINGWLSFCDKHHRQCTHTSSEPLPVIGLQVIDCMTRALVLLPSGKSYITLSYVWGSSGLDNQPSESGEPGLPSQTPQVVEDAIQVVTELGFQYLWVDRYCIPQYDKKLKHLQIQNMGNIYAKSTLTIISAAGDNAEYGLPGVGRRARIEQPSIHIGGYCMVGYCRPADDIEASIWNTRGWTYQEALLSARRLVFTDRQVYFQCQAMHCAEGIGIPLQQLHGPRQRFRENVDFGAAFPSRMKQRRERLRDIWDQIKGFWPRYLSFDNDAIDAISGVLAAYRDGKSPVSFLCGLPIPAERHVRSLLMALQWKADSVMIRRYEFPSWTWAGWKWDGEGRKWDGEGRVRGGNGCFEKPNDYLPGTTVRVEYEEGTILEWVSQQELILNWSSAGNYPRYLIISGWVFTAEITWKGDSLIIPGSGWGYTSPLVHSDTYTTSLPDAGLARTEGTTYDVVVMVFSYGEIGLDCIQLRILLLTQEKNDSCFERLDFQAILVLRNRLKFTEVVLTSSYLAFGELRLEKRELRIA